MYAIRSYYEGDCRYAEGRREVHEASVDADGKFRVADHSGEFAQAERGRDKGAGRAGGDALGALSFDLTVITSYSIHYTKLYDR